MEEHAQENIYSKALGELDINQQNSVESETKNKFDNVIFADTHAMTDEGLQIGGIFSSHREALKFSPQASTVERKINKDLDENQADTELRDYERQMKEIKNNLK